MNYPLLKKSVLVLLVGIALSSCSQTKLNYSFTFKMPYCGGAKPTAEILEQASKPQILANKTIIIKNSKTGKVDSLKTNQNGQVTKTLKYGSYELFEPWQFYKTTPDGDLISKYDEACLKTEWTKSSQTIVVLKKSPKTKTINIDYTCPYNVPCLLEKEKPSRMRE